MADRINLSTDQKKALIFLRHVAKISDKLLLGAGPASAARMSRVFSEEPLTIKVEELRRVVAGFEHPEAMHSYEKLPFAQQDAVGKILRSFNYLLERAENDWDLNFLQGLPGLEDAKGGQFTLNDLGYVDNPAVDSSKKAEVAKIQSDLTHLVMELRKSNSADDSELKGLLIALLKALLVLLGDSEVPPPAKMPASSAEDAKKISDHLKNMEETSESAKKIYGNISTILGGLLKLIGISP